MAAEWLNVAEVARRSGFSEKTVYRSIKASELEARKVRCRWRVTADAMELWLASGRATEAQGPKRPRSATAAPVVGSVARLIAIEKERG